MSVFRFLSKASLSLFFDRIEVEGDAHVPLDRPLLVVANHRNGLVDGLLVTAVMPRPVSLTAKSALRRNPLLALTMRLADAVPLYRPQDDAREMAKNLDSFEEIRKRLMRADAVCLFPEGVSHSDASLRQFKTGAARIALDFADRGGGGLQIVPVGLHYDAKQRFRSPVWVRFGKPIDLDTWRADLGSQDAARALTDLIEERIRELTTNFGRVREALWLRWTAGLLSTRAADPPPLDAEPRRYADRARLLGALRTDYEHVDRDRLAALLRELRAYRRELRTLGVAPEEVWLSMNPARAFFFVLRELELILAGSAIFVVGVVQHGLAFLVDRPDTEALRRSRSLGFQCDLLRLGHLPAVLDRRHRPGRRNGIAMLLAARRGRYSTSPHLPDVSRPPRPAAGPSTPGQDDSEWDR